MSRVVIGPDVFQTTVVRRTPESVALTSPREATGLFELQAQPEFLNPFEGMGVDTGWELRMLRAANLFDYETIADVLLTIEYTALDSYDYRQQVLYELDDAFRADRPFRFRHQFADQCYDLHNPELIADEARQMIVTFKTERSDYPPGLDNVRIQQVLLYFGRATGEQFEVPVTNLRFSPVGGHAVEGPATSIDGAISTRRGNAPAWVGMIGEPAVGTWELNLRGNLADGTPIRDVFKARTAAGEDRIKDLLFVVSYSASTPPWPA